MSTRMERYYKQNSQTSKRSEKNQNLYREIYEVGEYSNIEGIATIEKSNEVDISKIQNMLKNREQYQKQRQIHQVVNKPEVAPKEEIVDFEMEKNYDIRDVLNKAKNNKKSEEKYHSLNTEKYNVLSENQTKHEDPKKELRELIDTIANNSELHQMATKELSLDMFHELKSEDDTIIEKKDSIQDILDDAKKEIKEKSEQESMDNSFYTSSLNINKDDFEELSETKQEIKKNSIFIKFFLFALLGVISVVIILLIYNLLK